MAATTGSSSSSAAAADDPALALPSVLNVKLDPTNYPIWLAQIVPLLRSRRLISFVDGTSICPSAFLLGPDGKPSNAINPAYEDWIQMDQLVLSWINGSLSHPVLATVASSISARATWLALAALFSTPVPVSDNGTAAMVGSGGCGSGGGEMSSSSTTGEGDSKQMDLPGYKFSPTEEELVGFYLKKTIEGKDAKFRDRIPVIDVCNHKPSDLPEYFFSKPNYMNTNSNRRSRTTDEGFYKSTGKVREIKAEQSQAVIGNKRILSYYEGRVPKAKKTKHVMHEYSVTKTKLAQLGAQNNQQRELVLCHLTNKSAKSEKLKDDSICGDELAEPAIGNEISYNSEDDQAAATDMIQGPDEHLADKDVLLGTENRNECAESESPNGFSPTDNNDISTCVCFGSPGSFDVPGGFFLSDFDDLFNEPSCADLGENMDSTFISPEQLAATSATTPTSATSFGGFGVGSPDGFLLSDFDDGFLLSDFDVLF
ncbi:PREDICTED: NAC [Prunus dulcis]|uniref:PREDICTED: NAC n=1 Tax=Prunus dulcis TaxID=3755 RepID=A0A5E4G8A1_PRUDU|nr:PREDICTED: NAC [Prunus dulcis]